MALTPDEPHQRPSRPGSGSPGDPLFPRLAEAVRAAGDQGWARASQRVLDRVFAATPGSWPVLAAAPGGPVHISERVLVAHLRVVVRQTPGAQPRRISAHLDDDRLTGLIVVIAAEFGRPLIPLADGVRDRVAAELKDLLGPVDPPVGPETIHVHVADVVTSPRLDSEASAG